MKINSKKNRMTGLASKKISKKHVSKLNSLAAEKSSNGQETQIGKTSPTAKEDLPFKKLYRGSLTKCLQS